MSNLYEHTYGRGGARMCAPQIPHVPILVLVEQCEVNVDNSASGHAEGHMLRRVSWWLGVHEACGGLDMLDNLNMAVRRQVGLDRPLPFLVVRLSEHGHVAPS